MGLGDLKAWKMVAMLGGLCLLICGTVHAAPIPPQPVCAITAEIIQVQYIEEHVWRCPTRGDTMSLPSKYKLEVRMVENGSTLQEADLAPWMNSSPWNLTCEEEFAINSTEVLTIYERDIKNGDIFRKKQIINGSIEEMGDECFWGKFILGYEIIYQGDIDDTSIEEEKEENDTTIVTMPHASIEEKNICGPTLITVLALIPLFSIRRFRN